MVVAASAAAEVTASETGAPPVVAAGEVPLAVGLRDLAGPVQERAARAVHPASAEVGVAAAVDVAVAAEGAGEDGNE